MEPMVRIPVVVSAAVVLGLLPDDPCVIALLDYLALPQLSCGRALEFLASTSVASVQTATQNTHYLLFDQAQSYRGLHFLDQLQTMNFQINVLDNIRRPWMRQIHWPQHPMPIHRYRKQPLQGKEDPV
jgi:hypothetical protein